MIINPYSFGFNPLSLSPALWLDGSDASTLLDAGGNPADADEAIATWNDKSGNARHFAQSNASYRPVRKSANQNGRDLVQFSNTHHMLCTAFGGGYTRSLFIVYEDDSTVQYATAVGTSYTTSGSYHGHGFATQLFNATFTDANTRNGNNAINGASIGTGLTTARPANICILRCVSAGSLAQNITTLGADNFTPASRSITGRIAEVLVFLSALSAGNITAVEQYLSAKWGISLT